MSIENFKKQFRATTQREEVKISDEVLGEVTIIIEQCEPEKGQARLVIEANETPVRSCLLSAVSGRPSWWGYVGTTLYPELDDATLRDRYANASSHLPPARPIKSLIMSEVEKLRQAYAVTVCFEANRQNRSMLEPMPIGGYSSTAPIQAEWERIAHKVSIGPGCLFAPRG